MKKTLKFILFALVIGGGLWFTRPSSATLPPEGGGSGGGGTPNDTSSVDTTGLFAGWGKTVLFFGHSLSNLSFRLRVLTRDGNDSLRFYVQSTDHMDDTTSWKTLDSLGGLHVTVGYTERSFLWKSASDTLRYIGSHIRVIVHHGFSAASSLDTDTSRFYLDYKQWGEPIQ